jgi:hypothetical protein
MTRFEVNLIIALALLLIARSTPNDWFAVGFYIWAGWRMVRAVFEGDS